MPIEFDCENCSRTLRVPEGSSGKKSQCPACGQTQEIPFVVALDSALDPEVDAGAQKADAAPNLKEKKLRIPCPKCKHVLVCPEKLEGSRGQCRKCNAIFTITRVPEKAVLESTELVFNCPECNQLFEGREEMRGRKGKCHSCHAVFVIELKRPEPIKQTVIQTDNKKSSAAVRSTQPSKPIRFECQVCSGVMEVPSASSGLETECPYCSAVQTIPISTAKNLPSQSNDIYSTIPYHSSSAPLGTDKLVNNRAPGMGEPLALTPFSASALSAGESTWLAPVKQASRSVLSFSNALEMALVRLFPSCLLSIGHIMVVMGCYMIGGLFIAILMWILNVSKVNRDTALVILYVCLGIWFLCMLPVGGWFYGSISHMALRAVRKKTFDFGKCFSPGGAFEAAMLFLVGGLLLNVLSSAPNLYEAYEPGTLGILALLWPLLLLPVIIVYNTLFSLVAFAAIDGADSGAAFATSIRLVTTNIGVMIGVKILGWLMTFLLIIPTLGLSLVLPIYLNATLYELAKKSEES